MTVRIAGPLDKPEIWRLLSQGHDENGLFPYEPQRVHWWLDRLLQPDLLDASDTAARGVVGVIDGDVGLEAVVILVIGCLWYSSKKHLEEFIVYVDESHRTKRHLFDLMDWMKEQSKLTGLPLMTGIMSMDRLEAKIRLYQRHFPSIGAFFYFDPEKPDIPLRKVTKGRAWSPLRLRSLTQDSSASAVMH